MAELSPDKDGSLIERLEALEKIALIDKPLIREAIEELERLQSAPYSWARRDAAPSHALPIALKDVLINFSQGSCPACGWHLEAGQDDGCAPFNCSMRPKDGSPERERWLRRAKGMQEVLEWATTNASTASTTPQKSGETPRTDALRKLMGEIYEPDNMALDHMLEKYAELERELAEAEGRYQSAVHGRAEFRTALKTARQEGAGSLAGPAQSGEPAALSSAASAMGEKNMQQALTMLRAQICEAIPGGTRKVGYCVGMRNKGRLLSCKTCEFVGDAERLHSPDGTAEAK